MYQIAKNKVDSQHVCAKASGMPVHYKTKRPADRSADTASRPGKRAASGAAVQPAAEKTAGAPRTGTVRDTIHFGIQRKIVANMTSESWRTIPHCTYVYEADVTSFLQACRRRNARHAQHATLNTILLKVICEGLKAAPILNAHLTFQRRLVRGRIDTFENIDISMPMILPGGEMMTVKLPDCGSKSLDELTQAVGDIRRRAENTDFSQAMYDVSLQNTLNGLKHGRVLQAAFRLLGSKTGRHRVRTLHGDDKRAYMAVPESERLTQRIWSRARSPCRISAPFTGRRRGSARFWRSFRRRSRRLRSAPCRNGRPLCTGPTAPRRSGSEAFCPSPSRLTTVCATSAMWRRF